MGERRLLHVETLRVRSDRDDLHLRGWMVSWLWIMRRTIECCGPERAKGSNDAGASGTMSVAL
jgi:hypothetical protein